MAKTLIKEILERGVEQVLLRAHLVKRLERGDRLRVKFGIDPTGPKIHLGRTVPLLKLRQLQELGHQIVLVIGDFTAQIGDPSDKLNKRPMLQPEQIAVNLSGYRQQLGKILDLNKVEWRSNSDWLTKLSMLETAQLAEVFSFQQMAARRNFKERLAQDKDISLREFMYPLMQGYDSVAVQADLEIGGNDQLFNLLAGRQIQKHYNLPEQDILTTQMLEGTDGRKMSTSWGNVINITDQPDEMYGRIMSIKDELVVKYLLLTTTLPMSDIKKIDKELRHGLNPKLAKEKLAYALLAFYHGEKSAKAAAEQFDQVHRQKKSPKQIPTYSWPVGVVKLADLLVYCQLASSKSEARRLVEQGGVKLNQTVSVSPQQTVNKQKSLLIQVGKRRFAQIVG